MEFLILGPIEVRNVSGRVAVSGKPLAVLAVLLLHPNEPVSVDRLALALWGEDATGGTVKTVQMNVSRLRSALGDPDAVTTTPAGYCLRVGPGELDADRFEGLVEDARRALADGRPEAAAATLREALELWRGPALAELAVEPFAGAEIARLEEQRLAALELRLEADLVAGRHAEVVGELGRLVHANPLREGVAGQLMLALYRCGRQSEALEAYATTRRRLVEDLGIEPGPQLRELHEAILRQDATLDAPPTDAELPAALDPTNAPPLVGRDDELRWLLSHWQAAVGGSGALVALAGPRGAGKSRLAAELAHLAHGPGVTVLHASGDGPADTILVALRRAREATRPTLLVVDDADRAGAGVHDELERIAHELAGVAALVVACTDRAPAFAPATLELRTLDAEAVRTIAARYAPSRAAADVPADWLLEASAGVPRRVHEAAGQWARREAVRHVGVFADRAREGRAELRSIEDELTGGIAEARETRQRIVTGRSRDAPVVCPFKGLASFDVADERYFFGREKLVDELVARLIGAPLLGIVGPSGSGKSSVLRAGLLPALASGILPDSDTRAQAIMRPGRHPLRELAGALAQVQDAERVLLAVDQFEETFTACDDEAERAEFISELVQAAQYSDDRYRVVLALRADHYGRCAAYPELAALLAQTNVLVGTMSRDELRRAIEGPSQRAGLHVEPQLVEALVDEVEREPGGLPLLSTTLLELWQHRDGRRLTHGAYLHSGGVHRAVARLAEDAFGQLDDAQQAVARGVLMRLVGHGDGAAVERRRVPLAELEIDRDEDLARVVALLTDRRLLTVGAGSVELAHEALLREWPRLRAWIDEDRDGLRIQRGLGGAAEEWERLGRDEGALLRGSRLTEAVEWRDERSPRLNELERAFLASGEEARVRERVTRRRRMGLAFGSLGIALVTVTAVAVVAVLDGRRTASRELANRSLAVLAGDPASARAIGLEAVQRSSTREAENAVRQAITADRATAVMRLSAVVLNTPAASRDGSLVAVGDEDGVIHVVDLRQRRVVSTLKGVAPVIAVAFSPDAKQVASVDAGGEVAVADRASRSRTLVLKLPTDVYATSVEYDAAGSNMLIAASDGTVRLVPVRGGEPRTLVAYAEGPVGVARFGHDGRRVLVAGHDGVVRVVGLTGRALLTLRHGADIHDVDVSRDGRRIATAGHDGAVRIFDGRSGAVLRSIALDLQPLRAVRFSADAGRVVTAGDDGVVRVADVRGGPLLAELVGHRDAAYGAGFAGVDGDRVYSTGADGTLRTWALAKVATLPTVDGDVPFEPAFSPDGSRVVSGYVNSGAVRVWDPAAGSTEDLSPAHSAYSAARYAADGRHILSWSADGTALLRDVERGTAQKVRFPRVRGITAIVSEAAVDPAGGRIALFTESERVMLQAPDGSDRVTLPAHGAVNGLDFSADGRHLLSASGDGSVRTWNARTGARERRLDGGDGGVLDARYSPDGTRIVAGGADGIIRIWRLDGGDPLLLYGHEGAVNAVAFNRAGDRLVSGGHDGTVRVWDEAGGGALVLLQRHQGSVSGVAFGRRRPDGLDVVSGADDGILVSTCEVCGAFSDALALAEARPAVPAAQRRSAGGSG